MGYAVAQGGSGRSRRRRIGRRIERVEREREWLAGTRVGGQRRVARRLDGARRAVGEEVQHFWDWPASWASETEWSRPRGLVACTPVARAS